MNLGPHFAGFTADISSIVLSGFYRLLETFLESAPFLFSGILFAALMRGMIGHERLRQLLGGGGLRGAFRGWVLGLLLPVCALGALPVARELRRARLSTGTLLSFITVAPVMNPISVVYGISHINLPTFLSFLIGSFTISVLLGWGWDRWHPQHSQISECNLDPPLASARDRFKLAWLSLFRCSTGGIVGDLLLVIVFMGALGALLPYGVLQSLFIRGSILSPIIMGIFALPVYITPMEIMTQFEHVVRDGYSLGAAFMLVILGAGANAGVLNWVRRDYGLRRAVSLVLLFFAATFLFSMAVEFSPWQKQIGSTDHTHAFDSFTRLPLAGSRSSTILNLIQSLMEEANSAQIAGACLLAFLFIVSPILNRFLFRARGGFDGMILEHLEKSRSRQLSSPAALDRTIPLSVVVGAGLFLAFTSSFIFGRVIYDEAEHVMIQMGDVRAELTQAILEENLEDVSERLRQMEFLASRIHLGYALRHFSLPRDLARQANEYQKRIGILREFNDRGDSKALKNLLGYLNEPHKRLQALLRELNNP
ncbi:MAG: permease [Verrucomicrobia bacterium]|nr:permease [Verrucomicrobiota bacterium]